MGILASSVRSTEVDPASVIVLSIALLVAVFLLLIFIVYRLFFAGADSDYAPLGDGLFGASDVPHEFLNDEEALTNLAEEYDFTSLPPEDQHAYLKGEEFAQNNPPHFHNTRGKSYTHEDELVLKDRGISAFEFEQEPDALQPRYVVADKTEIHFVNNDTPYSTATAVLNYSLPVKNRTYSDTIYFETKVFEFHRDHSVNGHFAIGLVTKPYPLTFRLPGYNNFSIAYESTGNLKINKPFPTPSQQHQDARSLFNAQVLPPLAQSDIVGFGYVVSTGTIFITRNGKKVMDVMKGCFVDLYPAVGCYLANAKFEVNLGQMGFVWIEANVRKYGFVSTSDFRKIKGDRGMASLPEYANLSSLNGDKLLARGEELPPDYPVEELDFFGRTTSNVGTSAKLEKTKTNPTTDNGEKHDDDIVDETKALTKKSSSTVTNEPEEVMDMRERLYEQDVTAKRSDTDVSESTPLLSKPSLEENASVQATQPSTEPGQHAADPSVSIQNNDTAETVPSEEAAAEQGEEEETPVGTVVDNSKASKSPSPVPSNKSKSKKKKKGGKKGGKKKGTKF